MFIWIFPLNAQERDSTQTSGSAFWIPDYVKLQYAGGIGFISTGVGYTFFNGKLDMTLFYSYLPEFISVDDLHSISFQITGKLLKYRIDPDIEIFPLNIGFFTHHTFGSEYWIRLPDRYPKGYYWWYPGINGGIFIGGELKTKYLGRKTPASGIAFYTRLGTRGLYVVSKIGNPVVHVKDILEIGFGLALYR